MKVIFELFACLGVGKIFDLGRAIIKEHLLKYYITLIGHLRSIYFIILVSIISLFLLFGGLIILHAGLFYYLPWDTEGKIIFFIALGTVYVLVSLFFLIRFSSLARWLKSSGVNDILNNLSSNKTGG